AVELCPPYGLYLKPITKMTISVALPQLKQPGKSISNWEVMERLKGMVHNHQFSTLRISKSTMDFIRFEGEVENKSLDMNETLPGERPDTIHLEGLPCKWFALKESGSEKPSEGVLVRVFERFGEIRNVDIPMLDPYREEMTGRNFHTFSFGGHLNFEAYVQYREYAGFIQAMSALRGMKLMGLFCVWSCPERPRLSAVPAPPATWRTLKLEGDAARCFRNLPAAVYVADSLPLRAHGFPGCESPDRVSPLPLGLGPVQHAGSVLG
ncbi:hypothetical protein E2I00_014200, partial [Balaenoptera physalus]